MNQPIFNNPKLINPRTLSSWKHKDLECKIYRLAELFLDFVFHKYRSHACIIGLENPIFTSHALSTKFSTPTKPCLVPLDTWDNLIICIPQTWMDTITRGNQVFNNNEFFSTVPPLKDALGTVYRYLHGGHIQRYHTSNEGILTPIENPGIPLCISNLGIMYPALQTLKRVTVFTTQPPDYDPKIHQLNIYLTTFTLPHYPKVTKLSYNQNVLKNCYVHTTHPKAKFSELKKNWRMSPPFSSYQWVILSFASSCVFR